MDVTHIAIIISAASSSVSAAILLGIARWLYRIDSRTSRNHRTLYEQPGLVEMVNEHDRALYRKGMINGHKRKEDD